MRPGNLVFLQLTWRVIMLMIALMPSIYVTAEPAADDETGGNDGRERVVVEDIKVCKNERASTLWSSSAHDEEISKSSDFDFSIETSSIFKFLNDRVFGQQQKDATAIQNHPQESFMSILDEAEEDSENDGDSGSWTSKTEKEAFDMFDSNKRKKNMPEGDNLFASFMQGLSDLKIGGVTFAPETYEHDNTNANITSYAETNKRIVTLLERVAVLGQQGEVVEGLDYLHRLSKTFDRVVKQINDNFNEVLDGVDIAIPIAAMYYAAHIDSVRTPTWKRQVHRLYDVVTKKELIQFHEGLYLSALAYSDTVQDFKKGLENFQDGAFELLHGTTRSLPNLPASFLLIHKQLAPLKEPTLKDFFFLKGQKESEVLVVIVVRGTKDLADALADGLLAPHSYRDGLVHEGLLKAGQGIAKKYLPILKDIHEHTGRDKVKLILFGHSLGAGAAAVAAMEFREHGSWMKVEALGFGTPSLLSPALSLSTKGYITTVVCDSDIVPRMSGPSMANAILDLVEYDWTDDLLKDIEFTMERARDLYSVPMSILPDKDSVLKWVTDFLDNEVRPRLRSQIKKERLPLTLIPPGVCVHLFRNGYGHTGSITPCQFFSDVEVSRNIIDDHMVGTGYHRALLSAAQDTDRNYTFQFEYDVASLG